MIHFVLNYTSCLQVRENLCVDMFEFSFVSVSVVYFISVICLSSHRS
jgi:hypothetical protein